MLPVIEAAWRQADPTPPTMAVSIVALAGLGSLLTVPAVQTVLLATIALAAVGLIAAGVTNLVRAAH